LPALFVSFYPVCVRSRFTVRAEGAVLPQNCIYATDFIHISPMGFHLLGEGYYIVNGTVGVAEMPDSSRGRAAFNLFVLESNGNLGDNPIFRN